MCTVSGFVYAASESVCVVFKCMEYVCIEKDVCIVLFRKEIGFITLAA